MLGEDFSLTSALLVIIPLIFLDVGASLPKRHSQRFAALLDDIMGTARASGIERVEQIRFAIIERNGKISIIPQSD